MTTLENMVKEYHNNAAMISELKTINDNLKNEIIQMLKKEISFIGDFKVIYKDLIKKSLDTNRLKKEKPDLYAGYMKETHYKRFEIK